VHDLVICQDVAPTLIELAGSRPGAQIQGRSLLPLLAGKRAKWRKSFLIEYWAENAMPWLVGMTYKAVRTNRHKYIHWVNRGVAGELDELYDLDRDPYELKNLNRSRAYLDTRERLRRACSSSRASRGAIEQKASVGLVQDAPIIFQCHRHTMGEIRNPFPIRPPPVLLPSRLACQNPERKNRQRQAVRPHAIIDRLSR
jgi:hypothetical protein